MLLQRIKNMELNETICLEEHNQEWTIQFQKEKTIIQNALKNLKFYIEHIGSTAIPNIMAKPIIDIQIGISKYPPENEIINAIESIGYVNFGEAGIIGRNYFAKRNSGEKYNIHIVQHKSIIWKKQLIIIKNNILNGSGGQRSGIPVAEHEKKKENE